MSNRLTTLTIFVLALTFYLPFNQQLPVTDPVEANYALTAKEMLLSGDWMSPQIYGQYWFDKPVLIYWLIALSYKLFGINEFAARLPSALFSAGTVALADYFGQRLFGNRRAGLLCAVVLATSLEFWLLARMIITDAVLMFFNSAAMVSFYFGFADSGRIWYIAAYALAGLAVLTKGPVGLVIPGLILCTYILVTKRWELLGRLFILPRLAVFLAVVLPWYMYMYKAHGQIFIDTFLGLHNYLRATVSEHPKDNVFYYYFVLFPLSMLPWAGVMLKAMMQTYAKVRTTPIGYLLIWSLVIIGFFTLMATKYPTYVFPASFPAAILAGGYLEHMQQTASRKSWLWLSVPAILLFIFLGIGGRKLAPGTDWLLLYVITSAASATIVWLQIRGPVGRLPEAVALSVMLISFTIIGQGFITYANTRSAKSIVQSLPAQGASVASFGDYATSAVFYTGYTIPKLVAEEQDLKAEGVWSGKYTMPTKTIQSFIQSTHAHDNGQTYLIVKMDDQNLFLQKPWSHGFEPVSSQGKSTIYKRAFAPIVESTN